MSISNPSSSLRTSLHRDGFVIIPSLLPSSSLDSLRAASAEATAVARAGSWPHIRTLPKQFPPWPSTPPAEGIWGVQHLLHPNMPQQKLFAEVYFGAETKDVVIEVIGCEAGELVMELFNLLVRPDKDFELRWHRDDVGPEVGREEEERRLGGEGERVYDHAQWNLALYDDESLVVIPGSHRRARTDKEREAGPYEVGLEGEIRVKLAPGDAVFYDNNILHRGVYDSGRERMTLHGSMGRSGRGEERARNVLQHGVGKWVQGCDFRGIRGEGAEARAEKMSRMLVEMGKGREAVEYSQPD